MIILKLKYLISSFIQLKPDDEFIPDNAVELFFSFNNPFLYTLLLIIVILIIAYIMAVKKIIPQRKEILRMHDKFAEITNNTQRTLEVERKRIARDLQSGIGKELHSLYMVLRLKQKSIKSMKGGDQFYETLMKYIDRAEKQIEEISYTTRPASLDEDGIRVTLDKYVHWMARRNNMECNYVHENMEDDIFDPDFDVVLYRMCQEAVMNVVQHSKVKSFDVSLTRKGDKVELRVKDEGVGFDLEAVRNRHRERWGMGMLNMEERVNTFKGTLDIRTAPGEGTEVIITLPIIEPDEYVRGQIIEERERTRKREGEENEEE